MPGPVANLLGKFRVPIGTRPQREGERGSVCHRDQSLRLRPEFVVAREPVGPRRVRRTSRDSGIHTGILLGRVSPRLVAANQYVPQMRVITDAGAVPTPSRLVVAAECFPENGSLVLAAPCCVPLYRRPRALSRRPDEYWCQLPISMCQDCIGQVG